MSERTNRNTAPYLSTPIAQDVFWLGCNNGIGVHVRITMDTWNWAAYGSYWYPSFGGGGVRPITIHCHCP